MGFLYYNKTDVVVPRAEFSHLLYRQFQGAQTFRYESDRVYTIIFLIGIAILLLGLVLFVVGVGMS